MLSSWILIGWLHPSRGHLQQPANSLPLLLLLLFFISTAHFSLVNDLWLADASDKLDWESCTPHSSKWVKLQQMIVPASLPSLEITDTTRLKRPHDTIFPKFPLDVLSAQRLIFRETLGLNTAILKFVWIRPSAGHTLRDITHPAAEANFHSVTFYLLLDLLNLLVGLLSQIPGGI